MKVNIISLKETLHSYYWHRSIKEKRRFKDIVIIGEFERTLLSNKQISTTRKEN